MITFLRKSISFLIVKILGRNKDYGSGEEYIVKVRDEFWIQKAYKIKNIDLLMIRVFASLSIGLALMNFATLGLSEDDATKFLR